MNDALEQGSQDILSNRRGNIVHIHSIFAIALHMPMGVGAQPLDCFDVDRISFLNQSRSAWLMSRTFWSMTQLATSWLNLTRFSISMGSLSRIFPLLPNDNH